MCWFWKYQEGELPVTMATLPASLPEVLILSDSIRLMVIKKLVRINIRSLRLVNPFYLTWAL